MYKYKEPLSQEQLALLDKLSKKDFSKFNESDIREEYITKLLDLLGYEKNTDYEVEREESSDFKWLHIEEAKFQRFDYKFNIRKKYFWLIEAKSGKNQNISHEDVEQAYLYSLNPDINCRFFVVCNGWLFNLYDRNKFLSNDDSNIFDPILQIKNSEIKDKFEQLYSFLGSSEIIFKVKEDILLREIKNTLSAEINPDRIKQFSYSVDEVIKASADQVLENIRAKHNFKENSEKERKELEKQLNTMSVETITDCYFNGFMNGLTLGVSCKIIKAKLLKYAQYINFRESEGYSKLDIFFDYIFLRPMRTIQIDYVWNIIALIDSFERDQAFYGMMCKYQKSKIDISELIDKYLLDMFNFFENRPDLRAYIIVYPMYYRIIKCMIYGYGNSIIREIISKQIDINNYFWTEEDLEKMRFSKGTAFIMLSQSIVERCMSKFNISALAKPSNNYPQPSKPSQNSIGEVVNTEIIKRTISELDSDLKILEKNMDLDLLREQSQTDEHDEMFTFDRYYQNPWNSIFMRSINILLNQKNGHTFSEEVLNRAKYLTENRFLSVWHYTQMMKQPENRNMDISVNQEELIMEYGITINENTEHEAILSDIKYQTWDRPEIITWKAR
jgi:hypothetical protein